MHTCQVCGASATKIIQAGQIIGYQCQAKRCGAYVARAFPIKAIDWTRRLWEHIARNE